MGTPTLNVNDLNNVIYPRTADFLEPYRMANPTYIKGPALAFEFNSYYTTRTGTTSTRTAVFKVTIWEDVSYDGTYALHVNRKASGQRPVNVIRNRHLSREDINDLLLGLIPTDI